MATKTKKDEVTLTGYCMKEKATVAIQDAKVNIKSGKYIAIGVSEEGNKVTSILSQAKANEVIEKGLAEKGEGWDEDDAPKSKKKAAPAAAGKKK